MAYATIFFDVDCFFDSKLFSFYQITPIKILHDTTQHLAEKHHSPTVKNILKPQTIQTDKHP
jgi:hypothetical protein